MFKGTVSVVSREPLCKYDNANYYLIHNVDDIVVFLGKTVFNSDNCPRFSRSGMQNIVKKP